MNKAIIGKKLGMTQVFTPEGQVIPVTAVLAGPCFVTQKKTMERDGYSAIQVAFDAVRDNLLNKPQAGHFKKANAPASRFLREFRLATSDKIEVGTEITCDTFAEGDIIDVSGKSKGKGFSGVIKRHNQSRMKMTHGTHKCHRHPGSIGAGSSPGRVFKGTHLPGQYGNTEVTVQNLEVVKVDVERGVLLIKGAVPGPKGSFVTIIDAVKAN